jgi:hypothetical protein
MYIYMYICREMDGVSESSQMRGFFGISSSALSGVGAKLADKCS